MGMYARQGIWMSAAVVPGMQMYNCRAGDEDVCRAGDEDVCKDEDVSKAGGG